MKTRILIIGSKGMAGHVVYHYLKEIDQFDLINISKDNSHFISDYTIDITKFDELAIILNKEKPDVVINCVGMLNQFAENDPANAILVNSYLPHFLAKLGTQKSFRLIHISTDCVFSGTRGNYTEEDQPDGIGIYARSKALGEVVYGDHLTFRTSIIGPELKENGIGLMDWFFRQHGTIQGYTNAIWTGVTTLALAKAILYAIEKKISGLYHLVNGNTISKFDLLVLCKEVFNKRDLNIEPYMGYKVDKSLVGSTLDFSVGSYEQMVKEMHDWIVKHIEIYPCYYNIVK